MKVVRRIFVSAKSRIDARLSQFTDIVRKIISIVLTITVIGWCATFIYFVFYLYYVPIVYQEKPVYFHFRYALYEFQITMVGAYEVMYTVHQNFNCMLTQL